MEVVPLHHSRIMYRLSQTQLAYLAGLIDGEGTFYIEKVSRESDRLRPVVFVTNTSFELLEWVKGILGCGWIVRAGRPKGKCKQCYRYNIPLDALRLLLPELMEYLVLKKKHAGLFLEFMQLIPRHARRVSNKISEAIRERVITLTKEGYTQRMISQAVGISQQSVSKCLNGKIRFYWEIYPPRAYEITAELHRLNKKGSGQ